MATDASLSRKMNRGLLEVCVATLGMLGPMLRGRPAAGRGRDPISTTGSRTCSSELAASVWRAAGLSSTRRLQRRATCGRSHNDG